MLYVTIFRLDFTQISTQDNIIIALPLICIYIHEISLASDSLIRDAMKLLIVCLLLAAVAAAKVDYSGYRNSYAYYNS